MPLRAASQGDGRLNFPKFQQLVEERTGFRTMENPTASGEYFSDSCGDMYNFS